MKIAKEIKELLKSKSDSLKINDIMCLRRWQKDEDDDGVYEVDELEVWFDNPIGSVVFFRKKITARDTQGIIDEIADAVNDYAKAWADDTARRIRGGLW